jgi:hypothetical protein
MRQADATCHRYSTSLSLGGTAVLGSRETPSDPFMISVIDSAHVWLIKGNKEMRYVVYII